MATPLAQKIKSLISAHGPISVTDYFALCLADPEHGYYRTRNPFGRDGDFVTAPEVSQLFGEMLGIFMINTWQRHGEPRDVRLVEIGPGRGTMMADMLRVISRAAPDLYETATVHLVETSALLKLTQMETLSSHGDKVSWHESFDGVPEGFTLLAANELFDAIPIRQFVKTQNGFRERMVGLDEQGGLRLALAPGATPFASVLPDAGEGAEAELSEAGRSLAAAIGARIARDGGWALIVDYGLESAGRAASLQAVRGHQGAGILDRPGETDLSAHVDFAALTAASGVASFGPVGQGDFLRRLGLAERAQALKRHAKADQADAIDAASARLIAPDQMGTLFRVLALGDGRSAPPAGFTDAPSD